MTAQSLVLPQPYLLFVGNLTDRRFAKTAFGLYDWASDKCVGEYACANDAVTTGLPRMSPQEAAAKGARSVVIGVANTGGIIDPAWVPSLVAALEAGLDLVSGLHVRLGSVPELAEAASRLGRALIDVRTPPANIPVGTGRKRTGKRLLTVGTDCALGKKYTAMAITKAMTARGLDADFRATGQTGIMISGSGIPMDCVISDFEAGAAETLSPDAAAEHWDIVEGQGSLFHPGYAAVSLGLLHGSQPDVLIMCHEPGRTRMLGTAGFSIPDIQSAIELNLRLGSLTNPAIRCAGLSFNTSHLTEAEANAVMDSESERLGLPIADPVRGGPRFELLIDHCVN